MSGKQFLPVMWDINMSNVLLPLYDINMWTYDTVCIAKTLQRISICLTLWVFFASTLHVISICQSLTLFLLSVQFRWYQYSKVWHCFYCQYPSYDINMWKFDTFVLPVAFRWYQCVKVWHCFIAITLQMISICECLKPLLSVPFI